MIVFKRIAQSIQTTIAKLKKHSTNHRLILNHRVDMRAQALTFMGIQEMIIHIIEKREVKPIMEITVIVNIEIARLKTFSSL